MNEVKRKPHKPAQTDPAPNRQRELFDVAKSDAAERIKSASKVVVEENNNKARYSAAALASAVTFPEIAIPLAVISFCLVGISGEAGRRHQTTSELFLQKHGK